MSQTLKVHANSLRRVKAAMEKHGISSQKALAEVLEISLYKVREFMAGRPIDADTFLRICEHLELDWQKITRVSATKADEILGKESTVAPVSPPATKRIGIPRLASHLFRGSTESVLSGTELEAVNVPQPEPALAPEPIVDSEAVSVPQPEPELAPEPIVNNSSETTDEIIVTEEGNLPVIETILPHKESPIDWQELLTATQILIDNQQWDEAALTIQQFDLSQTHIREELLELCEQLLPPHWRQGGRRISDPVLHGWILSTAGILAHNLDLMPKALSYLETALKLTRQDADRGLEIQCFKGLAALHQSLGNYQAAISFYQKYFDLAETEDLYQEQAYILHQLGNIYYALHQYRTAISYYNQFLNHSACQQFPSESIKTLRHIGTCYIHLKHYESAISHLQKLAELTETDRAQQAYTAMQLGTAYAGMGLHHTAIEYLEQSRSIATPLDQPVLAMQAAKGLTLSYAAQQNYSQADRWGREWLTLARMLAKRDEQVQAMYHLRQLNRTIA